MDVVEYKRKVVDLFRSGKATDKQYEEMAEAVLNVSEGEMGYAVESIDAVVDPGYEREG